MVIGGLIVQLVRGFSGRLVQAIFKPGSRHLLPFIGSMLRAGICRIGPSGMHRKLPECPQEAQLRLGPSMILMPIQEKTLSWSSKVVWANSQFQRGP
jgi:hypothetical protein